MKHYIFLISLIFLFFSCSKNNNKQSIIQNSPIPFSVSQEKVEVFMKNITLNNSGISTYNISTITAEPKILPDLSTEEMEFYKKYTGVYIYKTIFDSKSIELARLIPIETSWGRECYIFEGSLIIDYNMDNKKFICSTTEQFFNINDINTFSPNQDYVKISNYENNLDFVNNYINSYKTKPYKTDSTLSNDAIIDLYEKTLISLYSYDISLLNSISSTQYGISFYHPNSSLIDYAQIEKELNNAIASKNAGTDSEVSRAINFFSLTIDVFISSPYHVYINQYINSNYDELQIYKPDTLLIELVSNTSKDYISFLYIKENSQYRLCFIDNGISTL